MGHLINPAGFRVGYFSNWADIWSVSNNFVYAELLHNSFDCRKILAFYFENFVTDKYSILYSHFTLENCGVDSCLLKMYFYDGIVEQKMQHLIQHINKFNKKNAKSHRRILRRFRKVKNRFFRVNFMNSWRYYDYLLARKLVFFFIYLLNLGRASLSKATTKKMVNFFFSFFNKKWFLMLYKNPTMSVYSFVKYYLKNLAVYGFDEESEKSPRMHRVGKASDFSNFLLVLEKLLNFWGRRHNFFRLLVFRRRVFYKHKFKKFLSFLLKVDRLSVDFFSIFYRLYLMYFRQSKFFKFMSVLVSPIVNRIGLLNTKIEFFGLDNNAVTAVFLSRYIARKLEMRFRISELFTPIGRDLRYLIKNTANLRGYKLQFTGRLTRRDRVRTS